MSRNIWRSAPSNTIQFNIESINDLFGGGTSSPEASDGVSTLVLDDVVMNFWSGGNWGAGWGGGGGWSGGGGRGGGSWRDRWNPPTDDDGSGGGTDDGSGGGTGGGGTDDGSGGGTGGGGTDDGSGGGTGGGGTDDGSGGGTGGGGTGGGSGGGSQYNVGPGEHEIVFTHDGIDRDVIIHVPDSFDPNNPAGYSVVFVFHGQDASAAGMVGTGMSDAGEAADFITVYPSAADGTWNNGNGTPYDDVGFVLALVNELVSYWNADADAIFATGHSQGGYFTQYLADQAPDTFAAYGVVTAGMATLDGDNQTEDEPFIFFHSTDDPRYPYEGWDVGNGNTYGGAEDTVEYWADQNNTTMGNFVALPDSSNDGMTSAVRVSADGTIEHYVTDGDSHGWPGSQYWNSFTGEVTYDINATDLIVDFFSDYGL